MRQFVSEPPIASSRQTTDCGVPSHQTMRSTTWEPRSQSRRLPASREKYSVEAIGQRNAVPSCQTTRLGRFWVKRLLSRRDESEKRRTIAAAQSRSARSEEHT